MLPVPKKFIGTFRLPDLNTLSPIPEIPNSACISPDLSPGGLTEASSKSAKIIKPSKIKKIRKLEKLEKLDFRFDKKPKKVPKLMQKKEKEKEAEDLELNSLNIYLKNKREIMKLIPNSRERLKESLIFLSKSPERSDNTLNGQLQSRRGSVPRAGPEAWMRSPRKMIEKAKDLKVWLRKQVKRNDFAFKLAPQKQNHDLDEFTSKEIQNITKNIIHKKF